MGGPAAYASMTTKCQYYEIRRNYERMLTIILVLEFLILTALKLNY